MSTDDYEHLRKAVNKNRDTITKTIRVYKFFEKLRALDVLSHEDYEEIDNSSTYHTSSEKAGHLLDIVDTKGPKGLHAFIDCLHEHYPHLYKQVTGQDPVAPVSRDSGTESYFSGAYNPVIDYDALKRLTTDLERVTRKHEAAKLTISELKEENLKLRFINTTCRSKLSKYPKVLENLKQVDLELRKEKEDNFNHILNIKNLEHSNTKLKFERKEMKQLIEQLSQKLEDAVNMHASQKTNWQRTNSKNEQLAHDKNNLEKKLEHMQREIETVKRQSQKFQIVASNNKVMKSSLWSKSFQTSEDHTNPQDAEVVLEILKVDKEELQKQNQELMDRLYTELEEMERKEILCDQIVAESEELKHMLNMAQKDLEVTDRNYQLNFQELQKVTVERNQAYEQRDRAQMDVHTHRRERDRLLDRLHEQLMQFKNSFHKQEWSRHALMASMDQDDRLAQAEWRASNFSDTSGVSSENDIARNSATLPAKLPSDLDTGPLHRPRAKPVYKKPNSEGVCQQSSLRLSTFPEDEIPLSPSPSVERPNFKQNRKHGEISSKGGVTASEIRKAFADKDESKSWRTIDADYGSKKIKDHRLVDLDCMKKSFRVRPILDYSFSLDYEDESEDLKAIFSEETVIIDKKRKKRHRLSRSLDNLNVSSDDSDESLRNHYGGRQPLRSSEDMNPRMTKYYSFPSDDLNSLQSHLLKKTDRDSSEEDKDCLAATFLTRLRTMGKCAERN